MRTVPVSASFLAVGVLLVVGTSVSFSRSLPDGSWNQSCNNASMKGSVLSATCQTIAGTFKQTFINVNKCNQPVRIANNDGNLVCESGGMAAGSWQASCRNASISRRVLRAECADVQGVYRETEINLRHCPGTISNLDGALTCD